MSFHIKKQTQHFVKQICSQPLEKEWEGIHQNRYSNRFLTKDKISWNYTECSLCVWLVNQICSWYKLTW